jgi:polysaccharide pyruvyl transferase WcaK-like protein
MKINFLARVWTKFKYSEREWIAVPRLMAEWRQLSRSAANQLASGPVHRLVILPGDAYTLVGSKGDEAMMQAVVARLAGTAVDLRVAVLTATPTADAAAVALGFEALPVLRDPWRFEAVLDGLQRFETDTLLVVGADVMDGYYSSATSLRMLAIADLAARNGIRTIILGFSFNAVPSKHLKPLFNQVTKDLKINVRDPISLNRFSAFCTARGSLVADVAFMLVADTQSVRVGAIAAWTQSRHEAGDQVIAFNIHPMLIKSSEPLALRRLIDSAVQALKSLLERTALSVVLLSHDGRDNDGDDNCLRQLHQQLGPLFPQRVLYPAEQMCAAELKGAAGLMDGVVTGRMHLAIASLGMGVPVAAITYQDKFQGLFDHFGLPKSLMLTPGEVMESAKLLAMMEIFVSRLGQLRAQVVQALPKVLEASESNLKGLI